MANQRVEINLDLERGGFLLQLRKEDVGLDDVPVTFEGKTFYPKDEVHITILGSYRGPQLEERLQQHPELRQRVQSAIEETEWSYQLEDKWYHVVREAGQDGKAYAESIIRMAEVPQLDQFYRRLETITGIEAQPRPAHVTLYIHDDSHGIGINTWQQFQERVRKEIVPQALTPAPEKK
jgi:hypothetical protein